ncbi:response regulator [Massilia sp. B-10]|nr:response regulator [Massilia sp. B-10]
MVEAAIRELPGIEEVDTARDSLQVRAKIKRFDPYRGDAAPWRFSEYFRTRRNQILMTVTPNGDAKQRHAAVRTGTQRLDRRLHRRLRHQPGKRRSHRALGHAPGGRTAPPRDGQRGPDRDRKELTVAKLSLLHAQVEPHFLYNTLASAQLLTRTDPARADEMLGNLILYLRHSLPRTEDALSTIGEELERAQAYLDILKIRMGSRLQLQIEVAPSPAHGAVPDHDAANPGRERDQARPRIEAGQGAPCGYWPVRPRPAWRSRSPTTAAASQPKAGAPGSACAMCASACAWPTAAPPALRLSPTSRPVWQPPSPCRSTRPREPNMPKCVIAEDETLLRDALVQMLAQVWPELEIVAACDDGGSALEAIAEHQPEVAFLDIRMPGLTGLEVAAALPQASARTQAVFVTAYDQYALDAFDRGAVDYLLKPVVRQRLEATVARIKTRLESGSHDAAALAELVARLGQGIANTSKEPPLVWLTASAKAAKRA